MAVLIPRSPYLGRPVKGSDQMFRNSLKLPASPFSYMQRKFHTSWDDCWDFPGGSDGKESACSAGDPGSIHGSGRSPGEFHRQRLQSMGLQRVGHACGWSRVNENSL